jgi:predicted Zn finger-like uncharacterized protein
MQTECPNCHTLFRITTAQLEMADGMVRCGFCKKIFDARVENDFHDNKYQLDVFEDTQPIDSNEKTEPDHASFFAGEANTIVPDDLRAESIVRSSSTLATVAWSLGILLLISTLVVEFLWFHHPQLLQNAQLKPLTSRLCKLTDCTHLQLRDPSQIEMVSRNVYSHPNEKDALMISTTMVNHATYAQPYPDVQIDFSNVRGELIASRRFLPEEYLQIDKEQLRLLPSGNAITFGLEIKDPGKDAITYEFSFH